MGASEAFAQARTLTWRGGTGQRLVDPPKLDPQEIPARGDDLVFPAAANLVTINDLNDLSVNSITIRDNYIISGIRWRSRAMS